MSDDLLPCPFCGGIPVITKHFRDESYRLSHSCPIAGPITFDWRDERIDLVTRWNTRSE